MNKVPIIMNGSIKTNLNATLRTPPNAIIEIIEDDLMPRFFCNNFDQIRIPSNGEPVRKTVNILTCAINNPSHVDFHFIVSPLDFANITTTSLYRKKSMIILNIKRYNHGVFHEVENTLDINL